MVAHRLGAALVIMDRFDAEEALRLIERHRVTVIQMVPTLFVRLLALPHAVRTRYDVSSLRKVVHAAAPCPGETKQRWTTWCSPIIHAYYGRSPDNRTPRLSPEGRLSHARSGYPPH